VWGGLKWLRDEGAAREGEADARYLGDSGGGRALYEYSPRALKKPAWCWL